MNTQEFLETVLPGKGLYCATGIKSGVVKQKFVETIDDLITNANEMCAAGADSYFACSTFKEAARTQECSLYQRSFWTDLDCSAEKAAAGKGYVDQEAAWSSIAPFCEALDIPPPFVVNSGGGLHLYWALTEDVTTDRWQPVADALKAAAAAHGFLMDFNCTADSARILRVPGTLNCKEETPREVGLIAQGAITPVSVFEERLRDFIKKQQEIIPLAPRELDPTTKALMGNFDHEFKKIAIKSIKGTGCGQIKHAIQEAATLPEPMWHAVLSIAVRCTDGEKAIQQVSKGHPEYDPVETAKKANNTGGPRTCDWYRNHSGEGEHCTGCTQRVTSPIQLGKVLKTEAAPTIQPASGERPTPTPGLFQTVPEEVGNAEAGTEQVEGTEPDEAPEARTEEHDLPYPFLRGINGGIYIRSKTADGTLEDALVYEHDLILTRRVMDKYAGESFNCMLKLPLDPKREFTIPMTCFNSLDKLKEELGRQGVAASKEGWNRLMTYTTAFAKKLQTLLRADVAHTQFGWADGNRKFVIGPNEVTAVDTNYAAPSVATSSLAPHMTPTGSYEAWREAFNLYRDTEGAEAQIFALFSAFGAPLMKFTGTNGALISLVKSGSGTGKTSVLRLVNSVWGHPDVLIMKESDSIAWKLHRIGVMNTLPCTLDELTNMKPADCSDLIYCLSQGNGRNRMKASANEERINDATWSNIGVCSGNSSIVEKMAAFKSTSEGEQMRVMEFSIDLIHVEAAPNLLFNLNSNYGHAGPLYAKALVTCAAQLPEQIAKTRERVAKKVGAQTKERFWINTITANILGAEIARTLGLHDYDTEAVLDWVIGYVGKQRTVVSNHIVSANDMLGEFLLLNYGATIVVNDQKVSAHTLSNIHKQAHNRIAARFEVDKQLLLIPKSELKKFCTENQANLSELLACRTGEYRYIGEQKKRMTTGTGITSPGVSVFCFEIFGELLESALKIDVESGGDGA